MSAATDTKHSIKGGEFLVRETNAQEVFIPEEFSEEQKMMAQACQDFIDTEIHPNVDAIDSMKDPSLVPTIFKKAGELGLLGISVPENYGGLGMSFNTSMLIADIVGAAGSFSTTYGAHTGIGTLPILYYGNEEQKQKYLPKLATGEWAACYCLQNQMLGLMRTLVRQRLCFLMTDRITRLRARRCGSQMLDSLIYLSFSRKLKRIKI